ncbi:hypothetical protein YTPLAS18_10350 [Nitrospira sp.]|nr:hypothetical protein YTPLAS18_10350 [Nitrospira sp.]
MGPDRMDGTTTEHKNHGEEPASGRAPRALTYDEGKAAEAAFQGLPFNPEWSDTARKVYDGIVLAMGERQLAAMGESDLEKEYALGQ